MLSPSILKSGGANWKNSTQVITLSAFVRVAFGRERILDSSLEVSDFEIVVNRSGLRVSPKSSSPRCSLRPHWDALPIARYKDPFFH